MTAQAAYAELLQRAREQALLASCEALLGWDELTYMPPGGADGRADQMAPVAGLRHDKSTDPRLSDLLDTVAEAPFFDDPTSPEAVNVREWRRAYDRLTRLPRGLIEELARVTSVAQQEWLVARQNNDFGHFRPWLDKIVKLKRREADAIGYAATPYDALLEDYEPGARSAALRGLFAALRGELVPLLAAIVNCGRRANVAILRREYPIERQRLFNEAIAAAVGFDFQRGRLDTTAHPFFSGIGPGDCRITTRYSPRDFSDSFFGMLHEVGHGLYEQNLDACHHGTPMGEAPSLGIHEAQARLWENTVGRGRAFWDCFYPQARSAFPDALRDVTVEAFHRAVNHVAPSAIRVQADEITYNLHILVRFDLEQALVEGDLEAADVPQAWNDGYKRYLGVTPESAEDGCLQDGHWASGLIGYFPTYTLGNIFSAQLFAQARRELGDLDGAFARGDFTGLLNWLRANVFQHGHRYPAAALIEHVTGTPPDHRPLVAELKRKYGELYGI